MVDFTSISIALAACASFVAAAGAAPGLPWSGPCGTQATPPKKDLSPSARGISGRQAAGNGTNSTVTLDLYYHVILAPGNHTTDFITDALLDRQTAVLNAGFVPLGYQFRLAETTRTTNASWFYNATQLSARETDACVLVRKERNVHSGGC